jgi:hypothetical protein
MRTINKLILCTSLVGAVTLAQAQITFNLTRDNIDQIIGESEATSGFAAVNYRSNVTGSNQRHAGSFGSGAQFQRRIANIVYRFNMPAIPRGEKFVSGTLTFNVISTNNSPGPLAVYLLDRNPLDFIEYYRNEGVGGTFKGDPNGGNVLLGTIDLTFTDADTGDKKIVLNQDAIALLNKLIATRQSTIAIRFNGENVNFGFDRWEINPDTGTSSLNLVTARQ